VVLARRGKGGDFGVLSRANTELIPAARPEPALPPGLAALALQAAPSQGMVSALLQLHPYAARALAAGPALPHAAAHAAGAASRLGPARF
jgi:hypothetical protein